VATIATTNFWYGVHVPVSKAFMSRASLLQ
jgi:hypothetical protein